MLISMAFVNPGDKVLVPDPGYPTYTSASMMAGAVMVNYPLLPENDWYPDFDALEKQDLKGVKIMWLNYPNMPTGAPATMEVYERAVAFGRKHNILIINDNPYSFVLTEKPLSIFAAAGSRECCLELNSLSKAHNMSGWRIGMVCGDGDYIAQVLKVKSQMDSGMFRSVQLAAVEALSQGTEWFDELNREYRLRRERVFALYDVLGAEYRRDSAGLFVWGRMSADSRFCPPDEGKTVGERVSDRLLYGAGVFLTPGIVFGKGGSDYVRASLCATAELIDKAREKVAAL